MIEQGSRIPAFYRLSVADRLRAIHERGLISARDYAALASGKHTLDLQVADKMIENVVGVMGLPLGLAPNFLINGRDRLIPMVVEEPSIVAALSSVAKLVRSSGGFFAESDDPILIGQVQIMDLRDPERSRANLLARERDILNLANSLQPKMVARGGGARAIEANILQTPSGVMLILHILVDTRDAMGANVVNTVCEGIASLAEQIAGGRAFLRILSNLTSRSLVRASFSLPSTSLAIRDFPGERVRDGIVVASDFAMADPHRAATHNKGIMNGMDAVAIATGNDWRAIEAGAHAYASRDGRYSSLTSFKVGPDGELIGQIEMPLKVGTVGGSLRSNPTVALNLRLLGARSATELAEIMACVGLAQNFAALRALTTEGIQQGHMTLHARSTAAAANAPQRLFNEVVDRLIASGEIKVWKAAEIIRQLEADTIAPTVKIPEEHKNLPSAHGKVILLGEHAVVYGSRAVALPLPLAVHAKVIDTEQGIDLIIPRWGVEQRLLLAREERPPGFQQPLKLILERLGLTNRAMRIEVFPQVPKGTGLGGSAAMAVAIIRAIDRHFQLHLGDDDVNALAFESEKVAHGTPSGIDNTVATYGRCLCFQRGMEENGVATMTDLSIPRPLPIVVGFTGIESLTSVTVARVRSRWHKNPRRYERIFQQIDDLAGQGVSALERGDLPELGELMNLCQGYLNALQVSSSEIETLTQIARDAGALGAKLTGGGGGGAMIALCEKDTVPVAEAMRDAGFDALEVVLG